MLNWDVANGVARRSWAGNDRALEAIQRTQRHVPGLQVTIPNRIDDEALLDSLF